MRNSFIVWVHACGEAIPSSNSPTISIRNHNERSRTTGAYARGLYKQRMISSTCLFSRDFPHPRTSYIIADEPEY